LPVLVIQAGLDPVGEDLAGSRRLVARYQALGLSRIETRCYTARGTSCSTRPTATNCSAMSWGGWARRR